MLKLELSGTLDWHTFQGSAVYDAAGGIGRAYGDLYLAGQSGGAWGAPLNPYSGDYDLVAFALD